MPTQNYLIIKNILSYVFESRSIYCHTGVVLGNFFMMRGYRGRILMSVIISVKAGKGRGGLL